MIDNLIVHIEEMQNYLFAIESDELIKHEYEKELLLGLLGGFEGRIKQMFEEKE